MTRVAMVRIYAKAHGIDTAYVDRLLTAWADSETLPAHLSWIATMEPYHGVLMLGLLRGDVVLPIPGVMLPAPSTTHGDAHGEPGSTA